jgi:hypothetical protein
MQLSLSMTEEHHRRLKTHLFPGDGKEAAAILLCGRSASSRHRLLVRQIMAISNDVCIERSPTSIIWSTDIMIPWIELADSENLSIVKIHSHPGFYPTFSPQDDDSDRALLPCLAEWVSAPVPHASVVMLSDGSMFGRRLKTNGQFEKLRSVSVIGNDIKRWRPRDFGQEAQLNPPAFTRRHAQAFGERTTNELRDLSVAVVGCSGTGSPIIMQLAHLGIGRLVLIDPDRVHELNLNRIFNATITDANLHRLKVDVLRDAVLRLGLGTRVERHATNLSNPNAVRAVAGCDIVIGGVDSAEGRFLMNLISNFYILPYIDVGVTLETNQLGEIEQVCGYVNYLRPGGSSLLSRRSLDLEEVRAEGLKRQNPSAYEEQRKAGYIKGVKEDRPAVISVNTNLAALAVNELIARIHPFREKDNRFYAKTGLSLSEAVLYPEAEPNKPCSYMSRYVGCGDVDPLLNLAELSDERVS